MSWLIEQYPTTTLLHHAGKDILINFRSGSEAINSKRKLNIEALIISHHQPNYWQALKNNYRDLGQPELIVDELTYQSIRYFWEGESILKDLKFVIVKSGQTLITEDKIKLELASADSSQICLNLLALTDPDNYRIVISMNYQPLSIGDIDNFAHKHVHQITSQETDLLIDISNSASQPEALSNCYGRRVVIMLPQIDLTLMHGYMQMLIKQGINRFCFADSELANFMHDLQDSKILSRMNYEIIQFNKLAKFDQNNLAVFICPSRAHEQKWLSTEQRVQSWNNWKWHRNDIVVLHTENDNIWTSRLARSITHAKAELVINKTTNGFDQSQTLIKNLLPQHVLIDEDIQSINRLNKLRSTDLTIKSANFVKTDKGEPVVHTPEHKLFQTKSEQSDSLNQTRASLAEHGIIFVQLKRRRAGQAITLKDIWVDLIGVVKPELVKAVTTTCKATLIQLLTNNEPTKEILKESLTKVLESEWQLNPVIYISS